MEGWVDGDTGQWKNPYGTVEKLPLNIRDQPLCPRCSALGHDNVLLPLPQMTACGCAEGHLFECVGLLE